MVKLNYDVWYLFTLASPPTQHHRRLTSQSSRYKNIADELNYMLHDTVVDQKLCERIRMYWKNVQHGELTVG